MKKLLFLLVLAGVALAALGWWLSSRTTGGGEAFTTLPVEYGRLAETVSATGVVQPREVFVVGTELAGKVTAVLADFNQTVEEGDILVRMDDRLARNHLEQAKLGVELARVAVRQAEANRTTAERALQRELHRDPMVRRQVDVDLVRGQAESARVAVEAAQVKVREAEEAQRQAEIALRLTVIRAPVLARAGEEVSAQQLAGGGVGSLAAPDSTAPRHGRTFLVLDRRVSVNQQIGPPASAQLFTLASDLDRMQVVAQVAEGDVHKVRRGQKADFTIPGSADNGPTFHATVEEVRLVPANDKGAIFYKVVLDARNERTGSEWLLRPGLTASVDILKRVHEHVWKLPTAALNFQPDDAVVTEAARARLASWRERPDAALWRTVWVAGDDGKPWPVFARVEKQSKQEEGPIQDAQFTEVFQWGPDVQPVPQPGNPATYPRVIISMPAPKKGGLFNPPQIKL